MTANVCKIAARGESVKGITPKFMRLHRNRAALDTFGPPDLYGPPITHSTML